MVIWKAENASLYTLGKPWEGCPRGHSRYNRRKSPLEIWDLADVLTPLGLSYSDMAHIMTPLDEHQIDHHHDPFPLFTLHARCFHRQARWLPWQCMICTPRARVDDKWVGKTWRLVNLSAAFLRGTTERRRLWKVSMLECHSEKYTYMAYLPCSIIPWRLGSECIWHFWKYRRSTMWDHEVCWSYTSLYSRWHGHTKFIMAM